MAFGFNEDRSKFDMSIEDGSNDVVLATGLRKGSVQLLKSGNTVTLRFMLVVDSLPEGLSIMTIPEGFRPAVPNAYSMLMLVEHRAEYVSQYTRDMTYAAVTGDGDVRVSNMVPMTPSGSNGTWIYGQTTYFTGNE